jgi:C-terminal processing protease CtpA/Prc
MLPSIKTLMTCAVLGVIASLPACDASTIEPSVPAPATLAPEAVRADFAALYAGLQASHYDPYARRPREQYEALFQHMQAAIDAPLPALEVWRRFQRFVAYGNVAHARIDPPADAWEAFRQDGGKAFPLFLRVVNGRAYVRYDYSAVQGVAPGDEIIVLQGQPVMEWLAPMRALVSADNDYLAYTQMETQLPMLVWLAGKSQPSFNVVLRKPDGRRAELTLPARDRPGFEAAAANRANVFELDANTRQARILDNGVAYLRPGPFYDNRPEATDPWDATAFQKFLDQSFDAFIGQGAHQLLIDLRDNPGGDNSFSDRMIAWFADRPFRFSESFDIKISAAATAANRKRVDVQSGGADSTALRLAAAYAGKRPGEHIRFPIPLVPPRAGERFTGEVYVLINRHSYSNAVLVAATVQDFGFGKILGEETADLASTYGALEKFTLPNTGLEVSFPKARILRPSSNAAARGVIPDIAITTPLVTGKQDVVLQQALAITAPGKPEGQKTPATD